MKRNQLIVVGVVLVMIVAIGGYVSMQGGGGEGEEGAPSVIKVGVTSAFTGKLAARGKICSWGYNLAVKKYNDEGGLYLSKYDKKVPIELIAYDDEHSPPKMVSLYKKLFDVDKVDFVLTPTGGSMAILAVGSLIEKHKCPWAAWGASRKIKKKHWDYCMWDFPPAVDYTVPFVDYLKKKHPDAKMAAIADSGSFAQSIAVGFLQNAKEAGLNTVMEEPITFDPDAKTVATPLKQVKSKGADVLLVGGHLPQQITATKEALAYNIGLDMMYMSTALGNQDYAEAIGTDVNREMGVSMCPATLETSYMKEFKKLFEEEHPGKEFDYHTTMAYRSTNHLFQAIEKAGCLDREKVKTAFETEVLQGFKGDQQFSIEYSGGVNKIPITQQAVVVAQMQDMHLKTVWPPSIADADPIWPW